MKESLDIPLGMEDDRSVRNGPTQEAGTMDFTDWTDSQLEAANTPRMIAASPKSAPAMLAEIERRKDAGIWMTDGSKERIEHLLATNTRATRARNNRILRNQGAAGGH